MNDPIGKAKEEFRHAKERLAATIMGTPDDKLNWSPSATARTPLQLIACGALGTRGMKEVLDGKPFPYDNMADMDKASRMKERDITTRKQAIELLEETSKEYLTWLDEVSLETLKTTANMPMGKIPMETAITFPAGHLHCRACQVDYIQTIYGDLSWHAEDKES